MHHRELLYISHCQLAVATMLEIKNGYEHVHVWSLGGVLQSKRRGLLFTQ